MSLPPLVEPADELTIDEAESSWARRRGAAIFTAPTVAGAADSRGPQTLTKGLLCARLALSRGREQAAAAGW